MADRASGSSTRMVAGCCAALSLAVLVSIGLLIGHLRARALQDTAEDLQALAVVTADQINRDLDAVDQLVITLGDRMIAAGVNTPDAYRVSLADLLSDDEGNGALRSMPQLSRVTARDAAGRLVGQALEVPLEVGSGEAAEFSATREAQRLANRIGGLRFDPARRGWELPVSRRIEAADGTFLGVVSARVDMAFFERVFATLRRGERGTITLFHANGMLMARHPPAPGMIGSTPGGLAQLIAADEQSVVRDVVSPIDGAHRMVSAERLNRYPLVVLVAMSMDEALEIWRGQALMLAAMAALLVGVIAAVGLMLGRQLRGQQALAQAQAALGLAEERASSQRCIGLQNERFGAALANMSQALLMFDGDDRLVVANGRVNALFALPSTALSPGTALHQLLRAAALGSNLGRRDLAVLAGGVRQLRRLGEAAMQTLEAADGRALAIDFRPMPAAGGGRAGWLATIADITDRRRADAQIAHMAHHDALTGLPNRVLFLDRLEQAVARGRRGEGCAVLCLDLDHFKAVNDTLGHPIGDGLLRAVTDRLLADMRETDTLARLGGDEFALIQSMARRPEDATAMAERLIERLSAPYLIEGHQVVIGASIGIAMVPTDGDDPNALLKHADLAMYLAKTEGRGRYRCFEPEMDARMQARRELETDLREALRLAQFEVFYQPLMDLHTNQVSGFEALIRWNHPVRGLVPPNDFIPLAEEIGLILPMGEWVLRRACHDAAGWPTHARVAVNLSPAQFAKKSLVEDVADALADSGLPPARLELEITETVMLEDTEATLVVLHRLRRLGVSISMDDFGTGYSSLSYLRRFPFDKVKIDRSFIQGLGDVGEAGRDSEAIVGAVTELCRSMGMATVAEGVETVEQLDSLRRGHCSQVQGYLFSRPRPADEVPGILARLNARSGPGAPGDGQPAPQPDAALSMQPAVAGG